MSEPFIGEIRIFANSYAPNDGNWLPCNGQAYPTAQYQALYAVIGNIYGGDAQQFNMPNFTGRAPLNGLADGTDVGTTGGTEAETITSDTTPYHTHQMQRKGPVSNTSKHNFPTASSDVGVLAQASTNTPYPMMASGGMADSYLDPNTMGLSWGDTNQNGMTQPHENRQPFLALTFCIACYGVFPIKP
jgi:microcystin-dependent protein